MKIHKIHKIHKSIKSISQDAKKIRATAPERLEAALRRRRGAATAAEPAPAPGAGWAAARKAPVKAAPSNNGRGEKKALEMMMT